MVDFWQHGSVTVLQRLKNRPVADIKSEITSVAGGRKIVLLLPALYSEFESASMPRIISELKNVPYLDKVVLSLDRPIPGSSRMPVVGCPSCPARCASSGMTARA